MRSWKATGRRALPPIVILLTIFGLYGSSLRHEGVYDDLVLIRDNPSIRSPSEIPAAFLAPYYPDLPYYRPLGTTSYVTDYAIWGPNLAGFHLTNLLWHAGCCLLLYRVLLRLLKGSARLALLGVLLFAVHPASSSVVFAITAREVMLASFFSLGALLLLLRRGVGAYLLSLVCFALALLSKETAVLMPIAFFAIDRSAHRAETWSVLVRRHLPFAAISSLYLGFRTLGLDMGLQVAGQTAEVSNFLRSWIYLGQTAVFPTRDLYYEPAFATWFSPGRSSIVALLVVAAGLTFFWWRERWRSVGVGGVWMVVAFLPTANLVGQETLWDERYLYPALMGIVAALLSLAVWNPASPDPLTSARRIHGNETLARRALVVLLLVASATAAVVTVARARFWADHEAFCAQWLAHDPRREQPNLIMAGLKRMAGAPELAIPYYERALAAHPESRAGLLQYGLLLTELGRFADAASTFERLVYRHPDDTEGYFNLGLSLERLGRIDEARLSYRRVLATGPDSLVASAHNQLGLAELGRGNPRAAISEFRLALESEDGRSDVMNNLGLGLMGVGQYAEAIDSFRTGLTIDPTDIPIARNLARLLATCPDSSLRDGTRALELARSLHERSHPADPIAWELLACASAETGDWEAATREMARALAAARSVGRADLIAAFAEQLETYQRRLAP